MKIIAKNENNTYLLLLLPSLSALLHFCIKDLLIQTTTNSEDGYEYNSVEGLALKKKKNGRDLCKGCIFRIMHMSPERNRK